MTRQFTGWHMTGILIAFFGVVMAVNLVMARAAIATFGGTVVDNSYVASQKYNGWLAAARKQEALGWSVSLALDDSRSIVIDAQRKGAIAAKFSAQGIATHPLGRLEPIALEFAPDREGALVSRQKLPSGRWLVRVTVRGYDTEARAEAALQ